MKRIWLLIWVALCLGGALWAALGLQATVESAAAAKVDSMAREEETLAGLKAHAAGQSVEVDGLAYRKSDIDQVMRALGEDLRVQGPFDKELAHNPVRRVVNRTTLIPRPEGWGVLAATNLGVHLRGIAGSQNEAERLGLAIRSAGQLTRGFSNDLAVDGEAFIESDHLEQTLQTIPPLTAAAINSGVLAVARWGGNWVQLDVTKPAEVLRREVLSTGLPPEAWETDLFSEVSRVRSSRDAFLADEEEKQRKGKLAPGHVVMAVRGSEILLRGELGSEKACSLLADAIKVSNPDRILIDELAHSIHRKPENSPKMLASALPRIPPGLLVKSLTVGTPDSGWKSQDLEQLDVENLNTITQEMLPEGLDRRLVLPDLGTCLSWLNSIDGSPMQRGGAKSPAFLMITAVGSHIYLRGAVAEEAVRTQIEAAARRLYSSRELDLAVRLDSTCTPIGQALQTLATLPPPPPLETAGIIAFAFDGEEWRTKPALGRYLEAEGLQQSGLLPDGVSVNLIMPDVLAVSPAVKAHLLSLSKGPPGIPVQSSSQP